MSTEVLFFPMVGIHKLFSYMEGKYFFLSVLKGCETWVSKATNMPDNKEQISLITTLKGRWEKGILNWQKV